MKFDFFKKLTFVVYVGKVEHEHESHFEDKLSFDSTENRQISRTEMRKDYLFLMGWYILSYVFQIGKQKCEGMFEWHLIVYQLCLVDNGTETRKLRLIHKFENKSFEVAMYGHMNGINEKFLNNSVDYAKLDCFNPRSLRSKNTWEG